MRTINHNLKSKADSRSRAALTAALCNRRTEPGARDSVEQAIRYAASPEKARYIQVNWLANLRMWANCAREHSALLLQVLSTNANEAFHRSLKSLAKLTKLTIHPKYSLSGIIGKIAECALQYDARAQKTAYDWSRKKLIAAVEYPWLNLFPYPVQLLLLVEIKAADDLAESGLEPEYSGISTCDCRFARSYWLPCRHVLCAYNCGSIDEPDWASAAEQFEESGFEVYYTRALVESEDDDHVTISRVVQAKQVTGEILDSVRTRFFELTEYSDSLDSEEQSRLLIRWEQELATHSKALIGQSIEDWIKRSDDVILF